MIPLRNRALLAPMSGITDLPFRRLAHRLGAGLVMAEMVASRMLAGEHRQTLKRVMGADEISPYVIQISGREPVETAEAAKVAADLGADMIDINMGCPARKVTKGLAGSALMKEPELALSIIEAVIKAVPVPVSLKMRLGWDENSLNAATIAKRAEEAGIAMITVHGRTRQQFYKGRADWRAIGEVVRTVNVPVIANGDILSLEDARTCLKQSGAYGVMIGRGAQGRPWIVGDIGNGLAGKAVRHQVPGRKKDLIMAHYQDMLAFYGRELGVRNARKHLGWYVDDLLSQKEQTGKWRSLLCREDNPVKVMKGLEELFGHLSDNCEVAA